MATAPNRLRIALAQMNQSVGDLAGNAAAILDMRRRAGDADLLVCPELQLTGYPPEDLVLRPSVVEASRAAVECLVRESHSGPALIATTPWREDGIVYNAAVVIDKSAEAAGCLFGLVEWGFSRPAALEGLATDLRAREPGEVSAALLGGSATSG